jgi:hypothetical protein
MNTVKIGPMVYAVSIVERLQSDDGRKLDGHIVYSALSVKVDAALAPQMQRQVLWHEILHGILSQSGLPDIGDKEEDLIDVLAYGIVGVLADNPELREPV